MESGPLTKLLALPPLVAGVVKMFVLVVVRLPLVIVSVPVNSKGRLSVTPLLLSICKFATVLTELVPLMLCADVPAMRKVPFVIVPIQVIECHIAGYGARLSA
jgi:hypothetical protein